MITLEELQAVFQITERAPMTRAESIFLTALVARINAEAEKASAAPAPEVPASGPSA